METERRSTLASLKGQLSEVNSSVKNMKATVVVGSVLTVACLAAVFGVTLLANEVSKETKVVDGQLVDKKTGESLVTKDTMSLLGEEPKDAIVKTLYVEGGNVKLSYPITAVYPTEDSVIYVSSSMTAIKMGDDIVIHSDNNTMAILAAEGLQILEESESTRSLMFSGKNAAKLGMGSWGSRMEMGMWAGGALGGAVGVVIGGAISGGNPMVMLVMSQVLSRAGQAYMRDLMRAQGRDAQKCLKPSAGAKEGC